jgi:HPt (histidine-containing phosphotransfer) domain-containing protein
MKEERERCLAAGADDHLTKPIGRVRLIETIAKHVSAPRAYAVAAADEPAEDDGLADFLDDPEVLEILKTFKETVLPTNLAALEAAVARHDMAEVSRIAHQLKGSVGAYLNPDFPASAEKLEREARGEGREALLCDYMKDLRQLSQAMASRPMEF